MNLLTDLFWILGSALSLGFVVYGGFVVLFVPRPAAGPVHLGRKFREAV
jgi:hypothetical protein